MQINFIFTLFKIILLMDILIVDDEKVAECFAI